MKSPQPRVVEWNAEDQEDEETGGDHAMKSWLEWQREAGDEYQRVRKDWADSEGSRNVIAGR